MKAVILAGGSGMRLRPLTLATNKHLLPVYNKPVIYYAIEKLVSVGITKIMLITPPDHHDAFVRLLGSGQDFIPKSKAAHQIQIVYGIQNKPEGIAHGLYIAKEYVGDDNCILYLGDNIIVDDIYNAVENFNGGATLFLKEVPHPERFGVASLNRQGRVTKIVEKPKTPDSKYAVTGVYIYDNSVFKKIAEQQKSKRGEYEISCINNAYISEGMLQSIILKDAWFDIGTINSLYAASEYMKKKYEEK